MRKFLFLAGVVAAGAAWCEGSGEGLVREESRNAWHLTVGPVMAPRVRVRVRSPRPASPLPVVRDTTTTGAGDVAAGPSAGYAAREYADGYVRPDEGTGDGGTMVSGLTWNWGADDVAGQYADGRMEFRTDTARWSERVTSSSYDGGSRADSDRDILLGVEAMGGWTFLDDEAFEAAVDAGFRFYGSGDLTARAREGTSVTTTRSEFRYVDSYDASGWTDVPGGAHEGTAGGPGRLIGATPTRREELMRYTSSTERHYHHVRTKLDYRIWDLRLGPTAGWRATDHLTIRGGVYGLLGLVDARLRTSVESSGGSYSAKKTTCEPVFGLAAGLSAQVGLTDRLFLQGGVEYDWWSDAVSLRAGGADARIKLSDLAVSLALGIEF